MASEEARLYLRTRFDESPGLYDRVRPVCPEALFDDLVALGKLAPGAKLVEIGCGTGQATLPLAQRGFDIVAIELGEQLAALARRKLAAFPNVEVINSTFEEWDAAGARFDGVVAVHSMHWIDPVLRYAKTAQLLRDDGILAIVTSRYVRPDNADPFWTDVQEDYADVTSGLDQQPSQQEPPQHPDTVRDWREEIEASGYYRDVVVRRYLWSVSFTAEEYVTLLSTTTWHRALAEEDRQNLFERILRRIEAQPEPIVRPTLLSILHVARRR